MKVRMRLIREWLISARLALRRMRFLACGVFAILSSSSMKNGAARRLAPKWRLPYPLTPRRSTLAPRAIEGRAAALDHAPNGAAARAWLPLPVIDREALGEIAELAVGRG